MATDLTDELLRLLDANLNRAIEGIRVIEETARMFFDNAPLTKACKSLRHTVSRLFSARPDIEEKLLFQRASERDVLNRGQTRSEAFRDDYSGIVRSNAHRAEEALRVIEEFSKLIDPDISENAKRARFSLYTLERDCIALLYRLGAVEKRKSIVYVAISLQTPDEAILGEMFDGLSAAGAMIAGLDGTSMPDRQFVGIAKKFVEGCASRDIVPIIHHRIDCALAVRASGVYVTDDDFSVDMCRGIIPVNWIIVRYLDFAERDGGSPPDVLIVDTGRTADVSAIQGSGTTLVLAKVTPDTPRVYSNTDCSADGLYVSVSSREDLKRAFFQ